MADNNGQNLLFTGKYVKCYELSQGSFGYRGIWNETYPKEVSVIRLKKLDCCDDWQNIVQQKHQSTTSHLNILQIVGYESKARSKA